MNCNHPNVHSLSSRWNSPVCVPSIASWLITRSLSANISSTVNLRSENPDSQPVTWALIAAGPRGTATAEEGFGALLEVDLFLTHPNDEPMMLVEAHPRGEGEVRTRADEHTAPAGIVEVEVVLDDPSLTHW